MLPATAGARPGKINMMFSPYSARPRLFPERNPSPRPTSSISDPTPHATPNIVRNERSLCAQSVRKICAKMSSIIRIMTNDRHCTFADVDRRQFSSKEPALDSVSNGGSRSEEHTSELQSLRHLVCRLLLEKKK